MSAQGPNLGPSWDHPDADPLRDMAEMRADQGRAPRPDSLVILPDWLADAVIKQLGAVEGRDFERYSR